MNFLFNEHRLILESLLHHQVDFILVGGYAVNYYGYNRSTADMDVWLGPDNVNKDMLIKALRSMGFDNEGLATIQGWDFTKS